LIVFTSSLMVSIRLFLIEKWGRGRKIKKGEQLCRAKRCLIF
jgi:hypothetical protein